MTLNLYLFLVRNTEFETNNCICKHFFFVLQSHRSSHIPSEVCSTQVINRPFSLVSLDDQDQGAGGRFQMKNLSKEHISGPSENKLTVHKKFSSYMFVFKLIL